MDSKGTQDFSVVADGVGMSRYYQVQQKMALSSQDQNFDSHDRFFSMAKMQYAQGCFTKETQDLIIRSTMTKDTRLKALVETYFHPEDYFALRERMIGSGAIGGKACGMLLARKIAETELPEFVEHDEPHDSFFIGSDVFYTYIVSNGDWKLRIRQRYRKAISALRGSCGIICSTAYSQPKSGNGLWMCWNTLDRTPLLSALPAFWRMVSETLLPGI